jgi:capsular polysaccharide biosynthesis protein
MSVQSVAVDQALRRDEAVLDRGLSWSGALTRRWWIPALTTTLAVLASLLLTSRQAPVYRSSTMLTVAPNSSVEANGDILRSLEALERRTIIATFAQIPGTVEARAAIAAALPDVAGTLDGYRISSSVLPNTNIVAIDVEGPDAARTAAVANEAAAVTTNEARSLYRIFTMKTLAKATAPNRPLHPNPRRNAVAAAIVGLVAGLVAAVVVSRFSRKAP